MVQAHSRVEYRAAAILTFYAVDGALFGYYETSSLIFNIFFPAERWRTKLGVDLIRYLS
jgi:hypothetical protein